MRWDGLQTLANPAERPTAKRRHSRCCWTGVSEWSRVALSAVLRCRPRKGGRKLSLPKFVSVSTVVSSIISYHGEGGSDVLTLRLLCCLADDSPARRSCYRSTHDSAW